MRRIYRPRKPPAFLRSAIVRDARDELFAWLRRPSFDRLQRRAPIREDIFRDPELTHTMIELFDHKCAYCETFVSPSIPARHFRPLSFGDSLNQANGKDYYAWLAYEWQNLLIACDACEKAKASAFPVWGLRATYMARFEHVHELEDPVLLDPTGDEPRRHLQFLADGSCVHKSERGAATIAILQLNRAQLIRERERNIGDMLADLTVRDPTSILSELPETLERMRPHLGAMIDVLRRVAVAWRGTSIGDVSDARTFVSNLLREIAAAAADEAQLEALARAVRELREGDIRRGPTLRAATAAAVPQGDVYTTTDRRAHLPLPRVHDRELESITIANLKAVDALDIKMPSARKGSAGRPCLAILGENSTGKSTILAGMALALIGASQARRLKLNAAQLGPSDATFGWDQLDAPPTEIALGFHHSEDVARFSFHPETGEIEGTEKPACVVLAYGPHRFYSPRYRRRPKGAFQRVRNLFDPTSIIPYPHDWLAGLDGKAFETVARTLRIVFALNDADVLVNDPQDGMCVDANGRRTPIEWLSEGYRSIFAMVVDILRELLDHYDTVEQAYGVVLIDEIETHLHPRWKMQIMTSLRRALPQIQFIVTTHDPLCLRGMDDDEVMVLERVEGQRIRPIKGLPSVRGMSAEQLLTSDYFGLSSTTDPKLELALAKIADDVVRVEENGQLVVEPAERSVTLIKRLSLGDSETEQVMYQALDKFLIAREIKRDELRADVRAEAVEQILHALGGDTRSAG